MNPQSEVDEAGQKAYQQFLLQQAFNLLQQTRALKVSLMLAESAGELGGAVRQRLYQDLVQCASIVEEVKT